MVKLLQMKSLNWKKSIYISVVFLILVSPFLNYLYNKYYFEFIYKSKNTVNVINLEEGNDLILKCSGTMNIDCLLPIIENRFKNKDNDLDKLYRELSGLIHNKELDSGSCHILSHKIGEEYLKHSSLEEGMSIKVNGADVDTNCLTGFYHGLMIGYSKYHSQSQTMFQMKKIAEDFSQKITENKDRYSKIYSSSMNQYYFDVIHGIGHVFFVDYGDIKKSISLCNELSNNQEVRNLCKTGVFMEYSFQIRSSGFDVPYNFCLNYPDELQNCMISVKNSESYLEENKYNFTNFCESLPKRQDHFFCLYSYFMQISFVNDDIEKTKICDSFLSTKKKDCLYARYVVWHGSRSWYGNQNKNLNKLVCSKLSFLDYLSCIKKTKEPIPFLPLHTIDESMILFKPINIFDYFRSLF